MTPFRKEWGDWTRYRGLPKLVEVDFHWSSDRVCGDYHDNMQAVWSTALRALKEAQARGDLFVLLTHGHSTSRVGKTTARSQVRKLMRSSEATPYILRRQCIEHYSVFVAAIRPSKDAPPGHLDD